MKRLFLPVVLSLFAASLAQADQITLAATCDPSSPTLCASPNNLIGGPVSLTVSLGADTLVFTTTVATQVIQGGITSFDSFFGNGGGNIELFDSHNHLLADGTFLPGATSTSDQGGVFSTFDGDISFFFLKPNKLGLNHKDKIGTGHFSYSFDATTGPFGDTSTYTLDINGTPRITNPEPATLFLLLAGLAIAFVARSLFPAR